MTTPTLSMQIFGEMQRKANLKRIRHEAAKKAWKTRRRMAKPSPTMQKILTWLIANSSHRLTLHYHGSILYYISTCYVNDDGSQGFAGYCHPKRITRTTHRAMEKRGWLEFVRRRESGSTTSYLDDGTRKTTVSFDLDYRISDKGKKVLTKKEK